MDDRTVPNAGLFTNENHDPAQQGAAQPADEEQRMFLRPATRVFENTNRQAIDRENRKRRGRATSELLIGNYVAVTGNYLETVPQEKGA